MAGTVGKILTGLVSISVLSVSSFLIHETTKVHNLRRKLGRDGVALLSTDIESDVHNTEWERLVKLYESENNNWKMGNLTLRSPSDTNHSLNIYELKKQCKDLLDTSLEDNSISDKEKLVKNWCMENAAGKLNKE